MKKITSLIAGLTFLCKVGFSQYYYLPFIGANQNPGALSTDVEYPSGGGQASGWTTILGPAVTTPGWSPATTIPFTFLFNGAAATSFMASSTGIVTFTSSPGAAPASTPSALPNAAIPDNSICIWGLNISGTNDIACTKTFGTAPNRQFWVQFNSSTYNGQTSSYAYWSIVLEETSNNIYIVDQRSSGTAALSLGIQLNATTAYSVAGSPAVAAHAGTDATPADNTYYTFIQGTQAANDIALTTVAPAIGQASWGALNSTKTISGTVQNYGSAAITAFTAKYSDGTIVSQNFTGLNIASNGTYNFSFTTPYTIATTGQVPLKVWVELTGDVNQTNDTLNSGIKGYSFLPTHKVVIEEGTGTWCGWCVRGAVFMDSINNVHPSTTVLIAAHNGDPMTDATYDAGIGTLISGYPSILVDRAVYIGDPSDIFTQYNAHINDFGLADLTITPTFNTGTRAATVVVDTKMASSFANNTTANDYRVAVVFTENNVRGTASGYDQHNYYSSQSQNLPLVGAGHNWQTEPATVVAANMKYDFVARTIQGGFKGLANSLPNTLVAGTTYSNTFNYTVPAGYNENNMRVHAILIDAKNNIIYNANTANLTATFGIKSIVAGKQEFSVYPNPVENVLNLDLKLEESDNVSVTIMNSLGETVKTKSFGKVSTGSSVLTLDLSDLASGAYVISVSTSKGLASNKFIK